MLFHRPPSLPVTERDPEQVKRGRRREFKRGRRRTLESSLWVSFKGSIWPWSWASCSRELNVWRTYSKVVRGNWILGEREEEAGILPLWTSSNVLEILVEEESIYTKRWFKWSEKDATIIILDFLRNAIVHDLRTCPWELNIRLFKLRENLTKGRTVGLFPQVLKGFICSWFWAAFT